MSKELLEAQIKGLKQAIETERANERTFVKSQTLGEQIGKSRVGIDKLTEKLEAAKKKKADLKEKRAEALKQILQPLADNITALLARGRAVVELDDRLFIGWEFNGIRRPWAGLSGGERVIFNGALSKALLKGDGLKILVYEMAEIDDNNIEPTLQAISKAAPDYQILGLTCHFVPLNKIPQSWKRIELK